MDNERPSGRDNQHHTIGTIDDSRRRALFTGSSPSLDHRQTSSSSSTQNQVLSPLSLRQTSAPYVNPANLSLVPIPLHQDTRSRYPLSPASPASPTTFFPSASAGSTSPTDEQSHFNLASDDKRRRNTAASARFRNKRKQATLDLERSISDLTGRAADLEREAADLRRENGWLKEIVILKSHRAAASGNSGGADIPSRSLWVATIPATIVKGM